MVGTWFRSDSQQKQAEKEYPHQVILDVPLGVHDLHGHVFVKSGVSNNGIKHIFKATGG